MEQASNEEQKYEFKSIGGGYSEGAGVIYDQALQKFKVEVNLYGGSKKQAGVYQYTPPGNVGKLVDDFLKAKEAASEDAVELQNKIKAYKQKLNAEINKEIITVLQNTDKQLEQAVKGAIRRVNETFK